MRIGGFEPSASGERRPRSDLLAHVEHEDLAAAPIAPAWITSCTASSTVMKKRVTSGWVTVIGPPASIWARNVREDRAAAASTLPNRTLREVPPAARPRAR